MNAITQIAASLPWHDWQFWFVTFLAACGLWLLGRPLLPKRRSGTQGDAGCPTCSSGAASSRRSKRRVALTVERKRI